MNQKNLIAAFIALVALLIAGAGFLQMTAPGRKPEVAGKPVRAEYFAESPLGASYLIDRQEFKLAGGKAEKEIAPGSAAKNKVLVFEKPKTGDMDGDGDDDALVILVNDFGGSGTFYYAALAVKSVKGFSGTNAVLLGDRISPQPSEIKNGVAIVNFAERAPGDPMTARPSAGRSKYLTLHGLTLEVSGASGAGEQVMFGYLTLGHEARTFRLCGEGTPEYWVAGDSLVLAELQSVYQKETGDVEPSAYAPLFAVVSGKINPAPLDGFGADYDYSIRIKELLRAGRTDNCKDDLIRVVSPLAGATIKSPLEIRGLARGKWFFEASFPVSLVDWDGRIIAQGIATAGDEWMTESYVPFTAKLEFKKSESVNGFSKRGALILQKDNPSGLPQYDDALEIPLFFDFR